MKENITLHPIGIIRTSYHENNEAPKQGIFAPESEGVIELYEDYRAGLKDLQTFSHAILIFYFHKAKEERLTGRPPMDHKERGIFAIRGPHRPNHIGLTVVKIKEIKDLQVVVAGVDMLDGTPLLDIKPYIDKLDNRYDADSGWASNFFHDSDPG